MPEPYPGAAQAPEHCRRWLAPFATINALIMSVITLLHAQMPAALTAKLYLVLGMLLHFAVLAFALTLVVILLSSFRIARPYRPALAVTLFGIAQVVIFTNVKVFSLYHFHLNGMVLNLLFSGALLENLAFSQSMWLSIAGVVLIVLITQLVAAKLSRNLLRPKRYSNRHHFGVFFAGYVGLQLVSGYADALGWEHITGQNRYIPWMPQTTMRSTLEKMGVDVVEKKTNQLSVNNSLDQLSYPHQPLQCNQDKPLNILMLVVDSLRADQLTAEIMPHTYGLKNRSLVFNNHFSTGNATRYGLFSLMYGLSPSYWKPMLATEQGSILLERTQALGYEHFIYGSSTLTFPEFDRTIFSALRDRLQQGQHKNSAANDADITRRLLEDLQKLPGDQPFFGFLFYDAAHAFHLPADYPRPFQPLLEKVNYLDLDKDSDPLPFLNLYKTTVHYIDRLIGHTLTTLEAQGRLDSTLVVITSDHGQEFNETGNNFWGHNSNFSQWQTKVPLVILWPGKSAASIDTLSSHEDLVPSLLHEAFGCTNPSSDYSTGYSLFDLPATGRGILLESWTDRAILYDNHLFLIDPLGDIDPVDLDYQPVEQQELPPTVLAEQVERMSRFLKMR